MCSPPSKTVVFLAIAAGLGNLNIQPNAPNATSYLPLDGNFEPQDLAYAGFGQVLISTTSSGGALRKVVLRCIPGESCGSSGSEGACTHTL